MMFSGRLCDGDHLHAELGGALRQRSKNAFAVALSRNSFQVIDLE